MFGDHLSQVRGRLCLAALCTIGVSAAEVLKPWPLKIILDHVIPGKPLPHALRWLQQVLPGGKLALSLEAAGAIVLIALAGGLLSYFQIFITSSVGYRMVYALRRELFAHLQRLSLSFHHRARSGDLLTKLAGDTPRSGWLALPAWALVRSVSYVLIGLALLVAGARSQVRSALSRAAPGTAGRRGTA